MALSPHTRALTWGAGRVIPAGPACSVRMSQREMLLACWPAVVRTSYCVPLCGLRSQVADDCLMGPSVELNLKGKLWLV